jgi:three-Cys-motif partner protein
MKDKKWGGIWTDKKLSAFSKYVAAYLRIMNKFPYWQTIYFDGFAGSGKRETPCKDGLLKGLFDLEDLNTYKGAAERVLSLEDDLHFDFYYFIDKNEASLEKLENRLEEFKNSNFKISYKAGDCNEFLLELSTAMKKDKNKYAALVLLDPFGMQISWDSIASLANTRSDVWILIPTGVIVNRLLDKKGELKSIKKLESFFGLSEQEIFDYFYNVKTRQTFFGEVETIEKISRPIEKIAELYTKQLNTIWDFTTKRPLRLVNSKGAPIFHFAFASNNANAVKIASQIISKR